MRLINRYKVSFYGIQIIIYRLLLDYCFIRYIDNALKTARYGRYYSKRPFDVIVYLVSWIILGVSIGYSKKQYERNDNSSLVLMILYLITFVPFTTMFGIGTLHGGFVFLSLIYWFLLFFLGDVALKKGKVRLFDKIKADKIFIAILIAVTILSVIGFGLSSGFRISFDVSDAYVFRLEAMKKQKNVLTSSYMLGLSRIVIPCGIVFGIKKRKFILTALFCFGALLSYGYDGGKTIFFLAFLSIIVGLFYKKNMKRYFPLAMIGINAVGAINRLLFSDPIIYRLIIRRLCFVPTLLNDAYYDFMLSHSPNYFSNLLRVFGYKDYYDIAYVLGEEYFGSSTMSANTGTIGDAIWQLGVLGAFIMPILTIGLLRFLDNCTINVPEEMVVIPCVIFAYYLNNSSFITACFTHALVPFCFIMATYYEKNASTKRIRITFGRREKENEVVCGSQKDLCQDDNEQGSEILRESYPARSGD